MTQNDSIEGNKTKASATNDNRQKSDSIGIMNFDKMISGELKMNQLRKKIDGCGVFTCDNEHYPGTKVQVAKVSMRSSFLLQTKQFQPDHRQG